MILVDTQAIAWLALEPSLLTEPAREAIRKARAEQGIAIAAKTLWELAMMIHRRKIAVRGTMVDFLRDIEASVAVLPMNAAIAARSMNFGTRFPKDPADRIIAATALEHHMFLVTSDGKIRKSGEVPCIW